MTNGQKKNDKRKRKDKMEVRSRTYMKEEQKKNMERKFRNRRRNNVLGRECEAA